MKIDGLKKWEQLVWFAKECSHKGEYYIETGKYKPWHSSSLKAVKSRGLMTIRGCEVDGVYYGKLTEAGVEFAYELEDLLYEEV